MPHQVEPGLRSDGWIFERARPGAAENVGNLSEVQRSRAILGPLCESAAAGIGLLGDEPSGLEFLDDRLVC